MFSRGLCPKVGFFMSDTFLPTTKYGDMKMQKWCTLPQNWFRHTWLFFCFPLHMVMMKCINHVHSPKNWIHPFWHFFTKSLLMLMLKRNNDVSSPKIWSPVFDIFLRPLHMVMMRYKNHVCSPFPYIGSPMSKFFLPTTKYFVDWMQKWCTSSKIKYPMCDIFLLPSKYGDVEMQK